MNLLAVQWATMYQIITVAGCLLWGKTSPGKSNSGFWGSMFGGSLVALSGMLVLIWQFDEVIGCMDNADARDEGGRKVYGVVKTLQSWIFAGNRVCLTSSLGWLPGR